MRVFTCRRCKDLLCRQVTADCTPTFEYYGDLRVQQYYMEKKPRVIRTMRSAGARDRNASLLQVSAPTCTLHARRQQPLIGFAAQAFRFPGNQATLPRSGITSAPAFNLSR